MKMKLTFVVAAAVLAFAAASVNAQTIQVAIAGSSAIWIEMGQASVAGDPSQSIAAQPCSWDDNNNNKDFTLTDTRPNTEYGITAPTDTGHGWVTWTAGTGSCTAPTGSYVVNLFVNTDSTVGNRCYFAVPRCKITIATSPGAPDDVIATNEVALPSAIITLINSGSGTSPNGAATDIRPEDAEFATLRALTTCGTPVVAGSQYLGLGYQGTHAGVGVPVSGSTFQTSGGSSSFNVLAFALTGNDPITGQATAAFPTIIPVGAVPVVVFVNPGDEQGFGSLQISNIDRGVLAGFLDGAFGNTGDVIPQTSGTGFGAGATVFLREPLSGTYNTMEYAIPNSIEEQSSQDVGLFAKNNTTAGGSVPFYNCTATGGAVSENPLDDSETRQGGNTSVRGRAIGTGNMVKSVNSTTDSLGYAFWGVGNFGATPLSGVTAQNTKYLTVDGIDPIQETWIDGLIPQTTNSTLSNVTLSHVKDGSYPIWSLLRVEGDSSVTGGSCAATPGALRALVCSADAFLVGLGNPAQPDFIPAASLGLVRSHFAPPGITFPCGKTSSGGTSAGTPGNGDLSNPECGGDVGGIVYTLQADEDWGNDNSNSNGNTGRRQ
jgi:hypothetical protein